MCYEFRNIEGGVRRAGVRSKPDDADLSTHYESSGLIAEHLHAHILHRARDCDVNEATRAFDQQKYRYLYPMRKLQRLYIWREACGVDMGALVARGLT